MKKIKTFEDFKLIFGTDFEFKLVDELQMFYACYIVSKTQDSLFDETFLIRASGLLSCYDWVYDTKREALVNYVLYDESHNFNCEILMSNVLEIIKGSGR